MAKKGMQPRLSRDEALDCTPVKNRHLREQRLPSGEVQIHYPVTVRPWMARLARWLGAGDSPPRTATLQLDHLGSSVWVLLDGRTSLGAVAATFAEAQQLEPREAEVAVTQFIRELGRRGLIGLMRRF